MNLAHNTWILDGIVDKNQALIDTIQQVLEKENSYQKVSHVDSSNFLIKRIISPMLKTRFPLLNKSNDDIRWKIFRYRIGKY